MKKRTMLLYPMAVFALFSMWAFTPENANAQNVLTMQRADNAVKIFEPLGANQPLQIREYPGALESRPVRVRLDLMKTLESGNDIVLQFSVAEQWFGKIQRVEHRSDESYSLFGIISGLQQGWFIFTIDAGGVMATIQIPGMNLMADLRKIQDDSYVLSTFDAGKIGHFECGVKASTDNQTGFESHSGEPPRQPMGTDITTIPQHDIMVVYTQGLVNDFPTHFPSTPLSTAILHLIDYANQSYVNSGVQLRLRLVYRGLVDPSFSEAGLIRDTLLNMLTRTSDGYLDQVHSWRTTFHADLVCLLYSYDTQGDGSGGGLAWLLDPTTFDSGNPSNWYSSGFSVVEGLWEPNNWQPPTSGMVLTEFTHEVGHNQGLAHNCADKPGNPVRTYAHGWRFSGNSGNKYITIMAYRTGAYDTAIILPNFSNPAILVDGQPTGSNSWSCAGTSATAAKNADALNLTADFMSRLYLKPIDPWVDFSYAGITQNGRFETPWKMLGTAISDLPVTNNANTPTPPTVTIKGPASSGILPIILSKRMRLDASGGVVRIGGQ